MVHFMSIYIPYEEVHLRKVSHPWLNPRCEEAISKKNSAEGSDRFEALRQECQEVLNEEYQKHLQHLKTRIANLPKGSKMWWALNRELLDRKAKCSSIPPLRLDGNWVHKPKEKADLIAKT